MCCRFGRRFCGVLGPWSGQVSYSGLQFRRCPFDDQKVLRRKAIRPCHSKAWLSAVPRTGTAVLSSFSCSWVHLIIPLYVEGSLSKPFGNTTVMRTRPASALAETVASISTLCGSSLRVARSSSPVSEQFVLCGSHWCHYQCISPCLRSDCHWSRRASSCSVEIGLASENRSGEKAESPLVQQRRRTCARADG